eukprot:CAMPEP_0196587970 /NCGR_PEP_ID=MMETSP1081-20130531/59198_1 /TAXON_ID=36882 /ORGANISM="Pyramimonas amylifera, Strain CCMP720" /LENGTH=107 /DNA_ID=CAMNT_0041910325 /DNA_START=67 /DNA_END=387 /DNA_ORIENTATION=-
MPPRAKGEKNIAPSTEATSVVAKRRKTITTTTTPEKVQRTLNFCFEATDATLKDDLDNAFVVSKTDVCEWNQFCVTSMDIEADRDLNENKSREPKEILEEDASARSW